MSATISAVASIGWLSDPSEGALRAALATADGGTPTSWVDDLATRLAAHDLP